MRAIGNKCAPRCDKLMGVRKNCNNISNINSGFVSCAVDCIVIFLSAEPLALHIKKKYRLLYIQKTTAQRHLFPLVICNPLFAVRWRKRPRHIWSSQLVVYVILLLLALHPCSAYSLKKQRCMKNDFPGPLGLYTVLDMLKLLYISLAQIWIIYNHSLPLSDIMQLQTNTVHEAVLSMHKAPFTDKSNINRISVFFCLQVRKATSEGHYCINSQCTDWIRITGQPFPFAVSVNLSNMHQAMISNAPPVHAEVIKPNMINGRVLKQLNLKQWHSNWRWRRSCGKEERKASSRLTVKKEGNQRELSRK